MSELEEALKSFDQKMADFGPEMFIYPEKYQEFRSNTLLERSVYERHRRRKITPLANEMVNEKGYILDDIKGTGTNGRIVKSDVEQHRPTKLWKQF
jgi:pyruvate/2-oxoglutarate dehydrogenase complex dihydrolipoamide acyltransferase (E2) component